MTDHKRLTGEELAEIRRRAQRALDLNPFDSLKYFEVSGTIYNEDIPKLLAEIEALQAENARLVREKRMMATMAREWRGDYR